MGRRLGGIGLAEKQSQPFKSTTVYGRLSHAADDHPRRRMLGHDQGSWRPLRGQPVTRRSAGRDRKAWGADGLRVVASRADKARQQWPINFEVKASSVHGWSERACVAATIPVGPNFPPSRLRETINMCNIWEPITAIHGDRPPPVACKSCSHRRTNRKPTEAKQTTTKTKTTPTTTSPSWYMSVGWGGRENWTSRIYSTEQRNNGLTGRHLIPFPDTWPVSPTGQWDDVRLGGNWNTSKHVAEKIFKFTFS